MYGGKVQGAHEQHFKADDPVFVVEKQCAKHLPFFVTQTHAQERGGVVDTIDGGAGEQLITEQLACVFDQFFFGYRAQGLVAPFGIAPEERVHNSSLVVPPDTASP